MERTSEKLELVCMDLFPRATQRAFILFSEQEWLKKYSDWYLAGGTALALQVGHRKSVDLDFFCQKSNFSSSKLLEHLSGLGEKWQTDIAREKTIFGRLDGAKASFVAYPFFIPKEPFLKHGSVQVLAAPDIAVMKIVAISQRGRKRDFVDLYWYVINRESLISILRRLPEQYPSVAHDFHHILKSIVYFNNAEGEPMPELFFDANWKEIKAYFRRETPKVAKELLKLE